MAAAAVIDISDLVAATAADLNDLVAEGLLAAADFVSASPIDASDFFDQVVAATRPLTTDPAAARRKAKLLWATLHGICLLQQSGKLDVSEADATEELVAEFLKPFLKY